MRGHMGGALLLAGLLAVAGCAATGSGTSAPETRTVGTTTAPGSSAPLPKDIAIVPPSSDIPKEVAAFSGLWIGAWNLVGPRSGARLTLDTALVVTKIERTPESKYKAAVIYSWGSSPSEWGISGASWLPLEGTIEGGALRVPFSGTRPNVATYRLEGSTILVATFTTRGGTWTDHGRLERSGR